MDAQKAILYGAGLVVAGASLYYTYKQYKLNEANNSSASQATTDYANELMQAQMGSSSLSGLGNESSNGSGLTSYTPSGTGTDSDTNLQAILSSLQNIQPINNTPIAPVAPIGSEGYSDHDGTPSSQLLPVINSSHSAIENDEANFTASQGGSVTLGSTFGGVQSAKISGLTLRGA